MTLAPAFRFQATGRYLWCVLTSTSGDQMSLPDPTLIVPQPQSISAFHGYLGAGCVAAAGTAASAEAARAAAAAVRSVFRRTFIGSSRHGAARAPPTPTPVRQVFEARRRHTATGVAVGAG